MKEIRLPELKQVADGIRSENKKAFLSLIDTCKEDDNYIRLLINIEIDLRIKSISHTKLIEWLDEFKTTSFLSIKAFMTALIGVTLKNQCISDYDIKCTSDTIVFLTTKEFINHLKPSSLKGLDYKKFQNNPSRYEKIIRKLGLSKLKKPFKNKQGEQRLPWLTKNSIIQSYYIAHKSKYTSLADCVNDILGLGYPSGSMVSIQYPLSIDLMAKKPTFLDGSIFSFPNNFINNIPLNENYGKTVCCTTIGHGMPEAVHLSTDIVDDSFEFRYQGKTSQQTDTVNLNEIAFKRLKEAYE